METKTALITGITGQDGSYLAELLLEKGYDVYGLVRKRTNGGYGNITQNVYDNVHWLQGDIRSYLDVEAAINETYCDEVYHLAAQSDVAYSFNHPEETYQVNITGTLNMLNAMKNLNQNGKMYFAGSSEMFGQPPTKPQNEQYPMKPRSPYAVSKLSGFWSSKVYREAYGMFISCGILYNHESPRRGLNFVTRKIAKGVVDFAEAGIPFELGNLDARKDWGNAPEYVEGMWRMLQADKPDDFILATNELHTVREFLELSLFQTGIDDWKYVADDKLGLDMYTQNGRRIVSSVSALKRPLEADNYQGDYSKAKRILGWEPKVKLPELVKIMVDEEFKLPD